MGTISEPLIAKTVYGVQGGNRNRITPRSRRAGPGEGFVAGGKQALVIQF